MKEVERLSNAIQVFHDEVVNLKSQVNSIERNMAESPAQLPAGWERDILGALEKRIIELEKVMNNFNMLIKSIKLLNLNTIKAIEDRLIELEAKFK